jgi:hypothetical protein
MSQTQQILAALQLGQVLTPLDALDRFGCFRLAARIEELRKLGHPIETLPQRTNTGKKIAAYYIKCLPAQKALAFV